MTAEIMKSDRMLAGTNVVLDQEYSFLCHLSYEIK